MWSKHKTGKFHASYYSLCTRNIWYMYPSWLLKLNPIHYLNHASIPYQYSKNAKILIFFVFSKYFVILSWIIFVGTLPICVIFLDMLHCLIQKICLLSKTFLACHSNSNIYFPFLLTKITTFEKYPKITLYHSK